MAELEFEDIQRELSAGQRLTRQVLSRRLFLEAVGAGVGMSMLPGWLKTEAAWGASALGASDGVLVVIQLGGGNDGLNTVVPTGDSTYYAKRGSIAIKATDALAVAPGVGLHPALAKLKARYDNGKVAIVQGVGYPNPDLSHFTSVANWQSGWGPGGSPTSGWLGRYLDSMGTDPMYGVSIGGNIPLHFLGNRTSATALPLSGSGVFAANQASDPVVARLADGMRRFGVSSTGFGELADKIAQMGRTSMDLGAQVNGCYNPALPSGNLIPQMALTARLINANLGVRAFGVTCGSFDTHDNQTYDHNVRLQELDNAIETFFATLAPAFAGRVTLMTFSEFGRRVTTNGSGTDHGTASPLFVVGDKVKGGLYGAQPSLTSLDSNGNLKVSVDFHSVYATVLDKWLNADSTQLLGKSYEKLDLFAGAPSGTTIGNTSPAPPPAAPAVTLPAMPTDRPITYPLSYRIIRAGGGVNSYGGAGSMGNASGGRVAAFAVTPTQRGYWAATVDGGVNSFGDAPFHGSLGGMKLNAPIVGMASTKSGDGYWLLGQDGGVFSFGDAQFFGSTGSLKLNKPVVGMAATPTGQGYWLVASDGGVFAFGDAQFFGSTGSISLNQPIVGIAATPTGRGYRFVAADGGVFAFGDATFEGSLGGNASKDPVIGIAT